jgi:hypothetical protein
MSKMNLKAPYGAVYGHDTASYEQNGVLYDAEFNPLTPLSKKEAAKPTSEEPTLKQELASPKLRDAEEFLKNILQHNPLSKAVVYKEAESNNQNWDTVKDAFISLGIIKIVLKGTELWKLPEELRV